MLFYPECMPCFLLILGWGPRAWLVMLPQRDTNLLLRAAWAPGHGCSMHCAKCPPTTRQEGNPIVAGWVFLQVQWGPLGQCLDVWRKQAMQDPSYLQASTLLQCTCDVPDCSEPFQVLPYLHLVSSSAAPMFGGKNVGILIIITFFMFFKHFIFLCFWQADHPPQI